MDNAAAAPPSAPVPDVPVVDELPPEHAETLGTLNLKQAFLKLQALQLTLSQLNPEPVRLELAELRAAAAASSDERFVVAVLEQCLSQASTVDAWTAQAAKALKEEKRADLLRDGNVYCPYHNGLWKTCALSTTCELDYGDTSEIDEAAEDEARKAADRVLFYRESDVRAILGGIGGHSSLEEVKNELLRLSAVQGAAIGPLRVLDPAAVSQAANAFDAQEEVTRDGAVVHPPAWYASKITSLEVKEAALTARADEAEQIEAQIVALRKTLYASKRQWRRELLPDWPYEDGGDWRNVKNALLFTRREYLRNPERREELRATLPSDIIKVAEMVFSHSPSDAKSEWKMIWSQLGPGAKASWRTTFLDWKAEMKASEA